MYTVAASQSLAAAGTLTSSVFPFDPDDIVIVTITNGVVPPQQECQVQLQLSVDNVNWVTVDTRDAGFAPSQAYYLKFNLDQYAGSSIFITPNALSRYSLSAVSWLYFRLYFSGNSDQAVTVAATGTLMTATAVVTLTGTATTTGGAIGSWTPPQGGPVIITGLQVYVSANSTGAALLNAGTAASATTSSVNMINAQNLAAAANTVILGGTGTSAVTGIALTTNQAVTFSAGANSAGFSGKAYITYVKPT